MHNIRVGVNKQENCKGINCQIVLRGLKVLKVLRVLQEYFASCQVVEIVISSKLTLGFLGHVLLRLNLVRQMNLLSAL